MTVFELVAKLTLDSSEYEKDLKEQAQGGGKLAGAWGKVGSAVKVGAAAIGAATVAVGALTKKSVAAYAEYEQLAGGVKKLYGDASDELMKYANEAYKTSGMSANAYMEQATSFSAALINSLGGDQSKAAKQTDVAMRAISDNFNTFGGDITNVQNAFQGFAKGNFMMLDNLRLGYGGTRSEMQRLIDDANAYAEANGKAADLSIDSFSDIVTAIEYVQEKQGIAGTTAKEAATTIEGSLNMTKAAWDNLIAGLANPDADMGQLIDNLIVAIVGDKEGEGLLNQLIPAVERAVKGIGQFLQAAIPALASKLPSLIRTFLPVLIQSATTLVTSLIQALPAIISALVDILPDLVKTAAASIADAIVTVTPELLSAIWDVLTTITTAISNVDWGGLGRAAFKKLGSGIKSAIPAIKTAVSSAVKYVLRQLGFAGAVAKVKTTFNNIKKAISDKIESAKNKVKGVIDKIKGYFPFSVGKIFSGWIPKIRLSTSKSGDSAETNSSVTQNRFAKAMNQPYMFTKPTVFEQKVAGEAGDEMLYGKSALMRDIREATSGNSVQITNYITVEGSESPEDFAERFVRKMKLDMRAI